jgi:threonine/homoserine/homoserine lactone efflux protein
LELKLLEIANLPLFMVASLVLLLTPGPAVLYIIARSIDQGRGAGLVSVLIIETGNFFHVIAATLGLSALLLSSATFFSLIKYLGAAYLIFLGVRKWLSRPEEPHAIPKLTDEHPWRIFYQGVIVAILNPKTALFFLAFLPQFVDSSRGSIPFQMFELGSIFVIMAFVTDSLYALLAGTAGQWLKGNRVFVQGERYIAGSVYIGLGVVAALTESTHK